MQTQVLFLFENSLLERSRRIKMNRIRQILNYGPASDISYIYGAMLHPKYKRLLKQISPFAIIWVVFATVYSLVEGGLMGDLNIYPSTGNQYDFRLNLTFTTASCLLVGLLQGWIEVSWLRKRFEKRPLWVKLILKTVFYSAFIFLFLVTLATLNSYVNFNPGKFDEAIKDTQRFLSTFAFWSIMIYIGAIIIFALFFSEIGQYLGEEVLYNFLFGKYHRPKQETRIFMFLDMKSSTTIAEKIGHQRYFDLLRAYYSDMTDAILETSGEIYQYVGDEIVVSWPEKIGTYQNNCIQCFYKISRAFEQKKQAYQNTFGLVPDFKAGYHIGKVTTGEIGIIKKDIIYTGDVLNTAARIQSECNAYQERLLLSGALLDKLERGQLWTSKNIGKLLLRGKKQEVALYSLNFID